MELLITAPINIGDRVYTIEKGKVTERTVNKITVEGFDIVKSNNTEPELIFCAEQETRGLDRIRFKSIDINTRVFTSTKKLLKHITEQIL